MFKGFSLFTARSPASNTRAQSLDRGRLERAGATNPRRPTGTPSVYVPDDYPAWFLAWKSQQSHLQVTRIMEEVARLGPAEFVSRRPLAGYQEEMVDDRKKYKKVTTRDWDTLRAGKVYKGEVAFKAKQGDSDKVQYLRCLDQRRRVLFIPLSARGEFFVASSKELPTSRTLPDKRARENPAPAKRTQAASEMGPAVHKPQSRADPPVQMRARKQSEAVSNSNLGKFENFLNWQRKMDLLDAQRGSGNFERQFPKSEIVMRRPDPMPARKPEPSRPPPESMDTTSGTGSRDIQSMDLQSIATGQFEEDDPYKRHFGDERPQTRGEEDAKRKILYYKGDRPPPKYQDVLDGKFSSPGDNQPGLSNRPFQNVWQLGHTPQHVPRPASKQRPVGKAPPIPVMLSPTDKQRAERAESPKPRVVPVPADRKPEHKEPEHRKEPKGKVKKGREREDEKGVKKREKFWDDFFRAPPAHERTRAHRK